VASEDARRKRLGCKEFGARRVLWFACSVRVPHSNRRCFSRTPDAALRRNGETVGRAKTVNGLAGADDSRDDGASAGIRTARSSSRLASTLRAEALDPITERRVVAEEPSSQARLVIPKPSQASDHRGSAFSRELGLLQQVYRCGVGLKLLSPPVARKSSSDRPRSSLILARIRGLEQAPRDARDCLQGARYGAGLRVVCSEPPCS
jgi:hypothetical protein